MVRVMKNESTKGAGLTPLEVGRGHKNLAPAQKNILAQSCGHAHSIGHSVAATSNGVDMPIGYP